MTMRSVPGQTPDRSSVRTSSDAIVATNGGVMVKEIPYDYVATFQLQGRRGNRVQDVINISTDGAFVASAIAYSYIPARQPQPQPPPNPGIIFSALAAIMPTIDDQLVLQCLLPRFCGIDFKYTIIDSGSGRELQNRPIHNIAGLGEAAGNRPFRPLAKPMVFMPRSTIRIEVEEVSEGSLYGLDDANGKRIGAELFIVFHGYKLLGYGTGLP